MQQETNPSEQDFLTAQAQRRSVYLADRRLMVNTTLTRAKDIRFAVDMELDKQSRDNYFALTQMDQSVADMTRGILGQAAKGVAGTGTDLFLTMQRLTAAGLSSAGRYVQKQRELSAASADFLAGRTTAAQTNERYQQIEAKYNELTRLGRNALDIMKQNHQAFMERAGLAKDEKDGFVYDFASGLTTLGAGVGATMASGNPAAASVLFAMYAGRQDYEEALENGITPGRAMSIGFAGGTMEGALEHLGLSGLEKIFKGKGILRAGLKGFITEATQEGSQQTAEEFIMQNFGGREKSFEDTFVDIAYSALLGGLTAAPISMVMNFAQRKFEEEGLKLPAAKAFARLAVESATSQAAQKMAHDTLRDVTSPLNYPNADPVQAAQEFGKLVKTEPDRAIMRKIYNVAERMEEKALNAGFDEPTAQLLGKIEQSRANSIYNLAGIKPGSQADMAEVQFLPAAKPVDDWETQRKQHQQRQAQQRAQEEAEFDRKLAEANLTDKDLLFQSAAAMYRNPARSLAEFVEFYNQNKENPKEQNKSFYRFSTASGAEVDVPFNRVKHIDKRHSFSKEQWSALERSIDNLEYAYYVPGMKGENNGVQFLCKINTPLGKAGVTLEVLPNGRVLLDTAVFDSSENIDNWAKNEPLQRPSHKKPVLVGSGIDNSIAGLQDFVKTQEMFAPDTNTLWQEGKNLFAPSQTSLNTYKEDLKKAQAGTLKTGQLIRIGRIGLYERLGFAEKPFGLSVNVLKKITEGKHNVKIQDIENLPQLIADPVAVFKSRTDQNSLVAVVSAKDNSNRQVITILRDTQGKINVIPSMYGKDNFNSFVASNIKEGNLIYIDEEKALKTIRPQELQLLKEDSLKGSIYNIRRKEDFVNTLPDTNTLWQGGLFDNQLELFGSQAEQEDAPSPAQEDLGVEVNSLFTQEELEADLPPFKPSEKPARIEDFGEKILGARKDVWGKYKHALEEEIPSTAENVTLGKFFPEPNYDAAIRQGITADTLAAVKALRDSIPAKPQSSYRQGQWLETLKYVRALSLQLLNGQLSTQQLQQMLQQGGRAVSSLTETISFYQTLGYPLFTKARGYTMHVQNYLVYNGHRFAEPTPIYEFKRGWRSVYGSPSKEETLAFARKFFTEKAVKGAAPTKLDLYQKVRTGEIVIGKKIASGKYIDLKGGFTKVADAQKYLEENQAHLEALLEAKRKMPDVRRKINEERIGKVYRPAGTVVTPERFMQEFGFRGVQFGNWVEQERRTQDLNNAYDALLDMANLLHIPSRAVSLDGQLGLAFGARGIPGAAAHYEHKQVVINLTKTQGAGSLGHEWWHALDNYFGKTSGQDAMQTVNPSSALRPEMKAAFEEVVRVTKAVLGERSRAVDSLRSKNYWSTNSEMTARAFESYLVYKAKQLGFRNDYLANIVHPDAFLIFGQDKYPYPFDNEMPVLAAAFDNFFNTIKTRESQKGYTLYQEDEDVSFDFGANVSPAGARGSVSFDPQNNTAIIRAVSTSDKSTAIHELYHVWRRDLKRAEQVSTEGEFLELMQRLRDIDANSQDYVLRYISRTSLLTTSQRQIMLQTIQQRGGRKYLEALARQDELDAQDAVAMFVRRGFEENFAVLAEKYFMKGVAPSAAYKSLFERFAQWLREIYNAIGQEVDLAPEVQDFFDRLMVREASQVDSKLFKGKVAQLKRLVSNIRQGNAQEVDGLGIQDLKALLTQLDAPRPKAVTRHLLKDLRRFGAEYANAANIDQEAYKQARVFNKAGGVDDRPDVWLQKHGYMEFEESTEETLAAAWDMLQRALDGEIISPQGYEEQAAQWANYKTNIDTLREVFGGSEKEARKTAQAILNLEEQGYRVVEQKDLANVSLRLAELDRLAERLENKSQTTQDKEQADKDILRAAQKIKNALVKDLNKRQVEGKGEMVKRLAAAKTFKEITQAVQSTLDFLNAAWAKTPQAQQEQRRLEVPATNWDKVRRDLLAQYTHIVNSAGEDVNNAYKKVAELSKLITAGQALTDEQAANLRAARQTIKTASGKMEARYVGAMESTLRQIIHITPQDARNFAARYGKNAMRFKALNAAQLDLFIKEAQAAQQKNYKRYIRGKLADVLSRKTFEKVGATRRAKYSPQAINFLQKAMDIWHYTQDQADAAYAQAVQSIDPDNPPSFWQALENRVLEAKARPQDITPASLLELYEDTLAAVRGDRFLKRLEGMRKTVQEDKMRLALELSIKERKLPKGIVSYLMYGGVDLQTFLDIAFGENSFDEYEPASPLKNELPQDAKPVTVLTGQEIPNLNTVDAKTRKLSILEWFRKTLAPVKSTRKDLGEISYPVSSAREVLGRSLDMEKIQLFPAIKDVVEKGVLLNNGQINKTPEHKGGIVGFYYIQGKVQLPEGIKTVQVDIAENELGKKFYFYSEIKETPGLDTLSRTRAVPEVNNSIAENGDKINAGKWKINFRDVLAPETNQIEEANFKARSHRDILRCAAQAYGLENPNQIMDKISALQNDKMEVTNYAYAKDEQEGEMISALFKNGKVLTHNAPRRQTVSRLEILTFWLWNQDHDIVSVKDASVPGGERVEDYGLAGRLNRAYGQDQLKQMFEKLTPQDLQFARNMQALAEKHYEQESLVHQRIYGFSLPKKEFYFPSVTDRITDTIDLKQEFLDNSRSPSFVKRRVRSKMPIQRVANPLDILQTHLRRAGEFIYNAEAYANLQRIFKQSSMQTAFLERFGEKDGSKVYNKLLALIAQQAPQKSQAKDEFYKITNTLFNGWVKAVMGLKPITGIKQFASSVSFAENMPWDLWSKWFAEGLTNPRKTADFMLKASPYIQTRYEMGGMNEAIARAMASDEVQPIKGRWNTFTNFMLINTRLGDKASLIYGGYPYMKYLLEVKGLSEQEAARVFEKQATRTLQSSLRVHLSQGQANADSFGARVFLVFKNQQLQYVRKVVDAYVQFKNGEISRSQFAKTAFLYLVLNPMVYTALGIGWFAADDDDWEEDLKNLLTSPVSQFFGAYPFGEGVAGFFIDNAASLVNEGKLTAPRQMGLPMFDDITRDVAKAVKTVNADEVDTMEFVNVFMAAAKYTGLPTQSVMNMGGGLVDIVTGKPVRGSLRAVGYTQNRAGKITGDKE